MYIRMYSAASFDLLMYICSLQYLYLACVFLHVCIRAIVYVFIVMSWTINNDIPEVQWNITLYPSALIL